MPPRERPLVVRCDLAKPLIAGYYHCLNTDRLYRANYLLQEPKMRRGLLDLIRRDPHIQKSGYTATCIKTMTSLVFSIYDGHVCVTTASYNLVLDELIDVRTHVAYQQRGLSRLLVGFVCRHFGPRWITARASVPGPGAPTHMLLPFYASFGYQIIPNSDRLTLMTSLAAIKQSDKEAREAEENAEPNGDVETAGAEPLTEEDSTGMSAIAASSNRRAVAELNRLYALLDAPNSASIKALLDSQSQEPAALITAIGIYDQTWFDQQPWATYHKAEFASAMASMLTAKTGRTNSLWTRIATSA